jgi:3-methyladenine DNA glycosylase AlkD
MLKAVGTSLKDCANPLYAEKCKQFFKTGPGEYAEHDKFLGIRVPQLRALVKQYRDTLTPEDCCELLQSEWHEYRLFALLCLVEHFQRGSTAQQRSIVGLYFKYKKYINNWDLVDASAYKIAGAWYFDKDRSRLHKMINAKSLWERRIPVIATFYYIRKNDLDDTFRYARELLQDKEDLTHKATGWMLREAGKRDTDRLREFLQSHINTMPRTMLRYAIEKLPAPERKSLLKK